MIGTLVILTTDLVVGAALLRLLQIATRTRASAAAIAFGLGHFTVFYVHLVAAIVGMPLGRVSVVSTCAALSLLAIVAARSRGERPALAPVRAPRGWPEWAIVAAIVLAFVVMLGSIAVLPVRGFDTRMIWAFHADLIYNAGTYPPPLLKDPAFVVGHPQYPPGIPLVSALAAFVDGAWDDRVAAVIPALFYPAIVALIAAELVHRDDRWGWYLCGAFALLPMLTTKIHGGADSGYVDLVVAFYVLVAAILVLSRDRPASFGSAAAAGIAAAGAATTKNEGMLLAVMVCAAVWLRGSLRRRAALTMTVTTIALVAPWKWVQAGLAGVFEERYGEFLTLDRLLWGLGRAGDVAVDMLRVLFLTVTTTGVVWWIVLGWWVASGQKREVLSVRALWIVPAYFAIAFVLYLITPWAGIDQVHTSFDRLSLHVAPLALWAVAGPARDG